MAKRRRGPSEAYRPTLSADKLKELWEESRKRREQPARWPSTPEEVGPAKTEISTTSTFDADGNQVIIELRGERAMAERLKHDQHFANLRDRVQNWNRKPAKQDKKGSPSKNEIDKKDIKDINGRDVMEVLAIAGALTNDPAYEAAGKAMRLHRLDRGGLRRAFQELQSRHGHDEVPGFGSPDTVDGREYDVIQQYIDELGLQQIPERQRVRQAIRHFVADTGYPGHSFGNAIENARKAYARHERDEVEQQKYLEELVGLRDGGRFQEKS